MLTSARSDVLEKASMKTVRCRITFLTPAFLGDAEQNARWRTPPFKHLLREWWRIAYAANQKFAVDVEKMRREEGLLFGNAWLKRKAGGREVTEYRKSAVRLILRDENVPANSVWGLGTQHGVHPLPTGLETSYAWFGLVKRGGNLPDRKAIKTSGSEASRDLYLAFPNRDSISTQIDEVLRLIATFGVLGARSRGGWGSLHIDGIRPLLSSEIEKYARPLQDCLKIDWAMSLAKDNGGVTAWLSTKDFRNWHEVMKQIAQLRREIRSKLKNFRRKDLRSALGFAGAGRMPSPLRWKVFAKNNHVLSFRVFAMPHCLPEQSGKTLSFELLNEAWSEVCKKLDSLPVLKRESA